jgi:hypothetical protein
VKLGRRTAIIGVNALDTHLLCPVGAWVADNDARRIWLHAAIWRTWRPS